MYQCHTKYYNIQLKSPQKVYSRRRYNSNTDCFFNSSKKLCNLTSNILFTNDAVAVQYFSLCNVNMVYEHDLVTQTVIELKSVTIYYGCTNTQKHLFIYLVWYRHQNGHNTSNHTPENLNSQDLFQMHSIYHNTLWTWFEATITIRHYR